MSETTIAWVLWALANVISTAPMLVMRRLGIGRFGYGAALLVAFVADLAVDTLLPSPLGATPRWHPEAVLATPRWLLFLHWWAHSSIYSAVIFGAFSLRTPAAGGSSEGAKRETAP